MFDAVLTLDGNILLWIQQNIRKEWLTPAITTITKLGNVGFIWIVISLFFLCFKRTRWVGAAGILALVFSLGINNIVLKRLVARIRPYEVIDGLQLLTAKATDFSFPSGHAGSSFAAATAYCCIMKSRWKWLLLGLAVLIALSRLYVGIHYPTDVLCGTLTGICCGLLAAKLIRVIRKRIPFFG